MDAIPTKELTALIATRDKLYALLQERRALGTFDAHAGVIVSIMEATLASLNYQIAAASPSQSRKS